MTQAGRPVGRWTDTAAKQKYREITQQHTNRCSKRWMCQLLTTESNDLQPTTTTQSATELSKQVKGSVDIAP